MLSSWLSPSCLAQNSSLFIATSTEIWLIDLYLRAQNLRKGRRRDLTLIFQKCHLLSLLKQDFPLRHRSHPRAKAPPLKRKKRLSKELKTRVLVLSHNARVSLAKARPKVYSNLIRISTLSNSQNISTKRALSKIHSGPIHRELSTKTIQLLRVIWSIQDSSTISVSIGTTFKTSTLAHRFWNLLVKTRIPYNSCMLCQVVEEPRLLPWAQKT